MQKAVRLYQAAVAGLTGLSLLVVFVVVLYASISRYAFNHPVQWSEELAKYAMIYGTMFGMILAYLHGKHVRFSFLENLCPPAYARLFSRVVDLATLVMGIALAVSGYYFVLSRGGIVASGLGMQMYWFQVAVPIGGVGLALAALARLVAVDRADETPGVIR